MRFPISLQLVDVSLQLLRLDLVESLGLLQGLSCLFRQPCLVEGLCSSQVGLRYTSSALLDLICALHDCDLQERSVVPGARQPSHL